MTTNNGLATDVAALASRMAVAAAGPRGVAFNTTRLPTSSRSGAGTSFLRYADPTALASAVAARWYCEACEGMNASTSAACAACGEARPTERVEKAPKLTLAQSRGLVPAPSPLLTDDQWQAVERTAALRAGGSASTPASCGTPSGPPATAAGEGGATLALATPPAVPAQHESCSICMEAFGLRDQVLLSCSHTFHRSCLESFERYVPLPHA